VIGKNLKIIIIMIIVIGVVTMYLNTSSKFQFHPFHLKPLILYYS